MICTNCGNEHANGRFCGNCGIRMTEPVDGYPDQLPHHHGQTAVEATIVKSESNVHLENVSNLTKAYWSYFVKHVKHPSISLTKQDDEFRNGFISLFLYAILFGLSFFSILKGLTLEPAGFVSLTDGDGGPSFSSVFLNVAGFVAVCIAIVSFGLFIIGKNFGPAYPFKQTLALYGAHSLPAIVIGLVALFLLLMKSYWYGIFLLIVSFIYVLMLSPGYVISVLLSKKPKGIDPLHGYAAYTVLVIILFGLLLKLLNDTSVVTYLAELKGLL
ncbi:zinc ribbon domain-containing protein [Sporosarcina koreensis]|uniref:zinc ribbon domain-containing protein n=1 Tax=Sporosarcina koreensis TaxID=334735 RepID=UPI000751D06D|nr:zinc ribbon domain-containing protein [Sporosarcina koreensis]